MAFNFVFLTPQFFMDYSHCPEIEQKTDRPYVRVVLNINGVDFAIPMRSNIKHPHAFFTIKTQGYGLDFSKAVAIINPALYIDQSRKPYIRQDEFDALRGKEYLVSIRFKKYIQNYKSALSKPHIPRNALLLKYSTLQYFHEYI